MIVIDCKHWSRDKRGTACCSLGLFGGHPILGACVKCDRYTGSSRAVQALQVADAYGRCPRCGGRHKLKDCPVPEGFTREDARREGDCCSPPEGSSKQTGQK